MAYGTSSAAASPQGLAARLAQNRVLTSDWRPIFEAVPREWFAPDVIWPGHASGVGQFPSIDRTEDERAWLEAVYSDRALTTQWDDGRHEGRSLGQVPTCSSSMPTMVAGMLDDLALHPGHRVLEIGTGTGWNTALLCRRVGEASVTTIEYDETLADQANKRLSEHGVTPHCVTGDGALGFPGGAPFQRVIATCSALQVPAAWLEQAPSGLIVAPWAPDYGGEAIVRMEVEPDGTRAAGRFSRSSAFMRLRQQRRRSRPIREYLDGNPWPADAVMDRTSLCPAKLGPWETMFALGVQLPGVFVRQEKDHDGDGTYRLWFRDTARTSWASVDYQPGQTEFVTAQSGDRDLWDEVHDAYTRWIKWGRPGITRFGLTVTTDGRHTTWLDHPARLIT